MKEGEYRLYDLDGVMLSESVGQRWLEMLPGAIDYLMKLYPDMDSNDLVIEGLRVYGDGRGELYAEVRGHTLRLGLMPQEYEILLRWLDITGVISDIDKCIIGLGPSGKNAVRAFLSADRANNFRYAPMQIKRYLNLPGGAGKKIGKIIGSNWKERE